MDKLAGVYPLGQEVYANPPVAENPLALAPSISAGSVVGPGSAIIGDVRIAADVFIGFHNVLRADSTGPFHIGAGCNIQDFVLIHCHPGETVAVDGERYGVYLEERVSVLHHAAPHGPLFVGRDTFIGQHVSIYGATIGRGCVLMHGAVITGHVKIGDNRFVEPGLAVWKQEQADRLPPVPPEYQGLNAQVVDHYYRLGKSYRANTPLFI